MPDYNNNNDKIGLVVWGCKGGKRVFCSRGVDVRSTEISNTIKDIRSYVRFNVSFRTAYAVEFTVRHKVFTIYRSCNDSGTGGYVAITVYVPHDLRVRNLREALSARMDEYFREFVNPIFGTYKPDQYDSIDQYKDFLMGLEVAADRVRFVHRESTQDDRAKVRVYESDAELDSYFDSPYRPEFYGCQEVMFLSKELSEREGDDKDFSFNFEPERITKVSEPEMLPHLSLSDDTRVKSLRINGKQEEDRECLVNESDEVEIILQKDRCDDLRIKGKVSALIRNGELVERQKKITIGKVEFTYKSYPVEITINGGRVPNGIELEAVCDRLRIAVKDSKAGIPGDKLDAEWGIFHKIGDSEVKLDTFKPVDFRNKAKDVKCAKCEIRVENRVKGELIVHLRPSGKTLEIPLPESTGKTMELYLPEGEEIKAVEPANGAEVDAQYDPEKKVVSVMSKITEFELGVPDWVKDLIDKWDFSIDGNSRKNWNHKVVIKKGEKIKNGTLIINGKQRDFDCEGNRIYPKILVVKVEGGGNFKFRLNGKDLETFSNCIFSYSSDCKVEYGEKYSLTREDKGHGLIVVTLKKRKEGTSKQNAPKLIINGCKGLSFYSENQQKVIPIKEDEWNGNLTSDRLEIKYKNNKLLCTVFRDESKYSEDARAKNVKNGFTVEYRGVENPEIVVTKNAAAPIEKDRDTRRKWKIAVFSVSSVIIVACVAIFVWGYFTKSKERTLVEIPVEFAENRIGDRISEISVTPQDECIEVYNDTIKILWTGGNEKLPDWQKVEITVKLISGSEVKDKKLDGSILRTIKEAIGKAKKGEDTNVATSEALKIVNELQAKYDEAETFEELIEVYKLWTTDSCREKFAKLVLEKADSAYCDSDTENMKLFLEAFKRDSALVETYKTVQRRLADERSKQAAEKKKKDDENALKTKANQYKKDMWSMDVTLETISKIEKWWKELSKEDKTTAKNVYSFEPAIKTFNEVLKPTSYEKFSEAITHTGYFSPNQNNVLNKFKENEDKYKLWYWFAKKGDKKFSDMKNF